MATRGRRSLKEGLAALERDSVDAWAPRGAGRRHSGGGADRRHHRLLLGLSLLDALYQSVTTVTTVGFREVVTEPSAAFRIFTMAFVSAGVGAVLYTLGILFGTLVEGRLTDQIGRRRMERELAAVRDHVVVCGWGRVGRAIAANVGTRAPSRSSSVTSTGRRRCQAWSSTATPPTTRS
ncbi:MAG: ion channel [Acidimicrobiales bacterium]